MEAYANKMGVCGRGGGGGVMSMWMFPYNCFLIQYLVYKLLVIITRFFVCFIKIPALLKISVLKNYISFVHLVYN